MGLQARWLVLENFKSYEGRARIGPFKKFTCVVGPNGAGKSNLVDAISFVLGVPARHLRGAQLRDLINRRAGQDPLGRGTSVELVCERSADDGGGADDAHDPGARGPVEVVFRRELMAGGEQSRFLIDGEALSQADYLGRLSELNLLPKAKNFLVSQGDLEAASWRQGRELTHLFEQVSGSTELRHNYEQLEAEKASKEDSARVLYMRKRNAESERKRVSHQKDEADKYRQVEADRKECQLQSFLFRLFCIKCQIEESERLIQEEERNRTAALGFEASRQARAQEAERERAEVRLKARDAGRAVELAEQRLHGAGTNEDAAKAESLEARLEELRSSAERFTKRMQALREQVADLHTERSGIDEEVQRLQREAASRQIAFTDAQRKEFDQAKANAEKVTAPTSAQVRDLEAQIRTAAEDRGRAERDARELTTRRNHLRQRVSDLIDAQEEARSTMRRDEQLARDRSEQLRTVRVSAEANEREKGRLLEERDKVLKDVQDITATDRQIQVERKLAQTIQELVHTVPGVHGRVLNLFSVSNERMEVALNVALGGYLDGVVTASADGARQCVRHLKDRMLQALTFLPLDSMKGQPPANRLVELLRDRPGLRTALSCVSFDRQFHKAFEFLLSDVVIADNLEEARSFMFEDLADKGVACRVVTVQGETISRDGNMSFSSDASRKDTTRFELATLGAKKAQLEGIDRRLAELHAHEAVTGDAAALAAEVGRSEERAASSRQALGQRETELKLRQEDLESTGRELEDCAAEARRLEAKEDTLRGQQRALEEEIGEVVFTHFAALSTKMGVDDIRKREREARRSAEEALQRSRALEQKKSIIETEVKMLAQTLAERDARDPAAELAGVEAEVAALAARREAEASGASATLTEERLAELRRQWQALQEEERASEKVAGELVREVRDAQGKVTELCRSIKGLSSEVSALQDARLALLRQSVLEGVDLPLLGGRTAEFLQELATATSHREVEAGVDLDAVVDLSALPPEKRDAAKVGGPAAQLMEAEYRERLSQKEKELERLLPNMKAASQLSEAVRQERGAKQSVVDGRADIEDVKHRFEDVREKRRERFMKCFTAVQQEINAVYKRLTAFGVGGGEGGSAYLDLEDVQDPYSAGVKFTAMPPSKRFTDVAMLSGGERALAAMALLFAMQAFQRPPFLVLDEVDAHLDSSNIQALAKYVSQSDCQMIVVSLKDQFFTRSEGLVGVTKNLETSVIFTVDLDQFRRQPPAPLPEALPLGDASASRPRGPAAPPPLGAPPLAAPSPGRPGAATAGGAGGPGAVGGGGGSASPPPPAG